MAVVANKRSIMTLFSDPNDLYSHQVRIVLAEKGIGVDVIDVPADNKPQSLTDINPYGTVPTLVDRDLVLYQASIIMEYLDERFPHPPLLPVYPVARAKCRLMVHRIQEDWYSLYYNIINNKDAENARQQLHNSLLGLNPVFAEQPYFLSEDFSMVDCCLATLFWRLPSIGLQLPSSAKAFYAYCDRLFKRSDFKASLSDIERELNQTQLLY